MATAAIDAAPYYADLQCNTCIPPGYVPYIILLKLILAANGDPVSTDPNVLLNQARCLISCIPPGLVGGVISSVAGSGSAAASGCCNSDGVIDPVAAPTDPTVTNMYTNTAPTPKTVWVWPAGGAAWIQVV